MKGLLYLLAAYFLGELLSVAISGFIPGTILGMIILFCALQFKVIKEKDIKAVANVLLDNMMLLLVPISVGLMIAASTIGDNIIQIVIILLSTTALVMGVVGLLQQKLGGKKNDR
ncbi:MAG: CidA/LrgA family protein [Rikenellaceae bacterium]